MTNKTPLISIVLPTYNGSRYLRQSIESCLNQTYKNIELIIVDDCSTDETPLIIQEYVQKEPRVQCIRNQQNQRLPRSLNIGFAQAKGEYLTWTSDDNFYAREAIERMIAYLSDKKHDFVYCDIFTMDEENETIVSREKLDGYETLKKHNCIRACFLYARRVMETVGGYDPDMELLEDYDYWVRVSRQFPMGHIAEPLYYYRYHSRSLWSSRIREIRIAEFLFKLKYDFMSDEKTNWYLREIFVKYNNTYPEIINKTLARLFLKKKIKRILNGLKSGEVSFAAARQKLAEMINKSNSGRGAKALPHFVFFRRLPYDGEWGGMEKLLLDWFERIDYRECKVTLAVTVPWQDRFGREFKKRNLPVAVVNFPFEFERSIFKQFKNMFFFLHRIRPSAVIFSQAWYSEFNMGDIFATFLVTRGKVFMHENLGAPEPMEKPSKKYFGIIPRLSLWWCLQRTLINLRAYFCTRIFTVSRDMKDRYVSLWKYSPRRIEVAYHGIDSASFFPLKERCREIRRELGIAERDIVIISTARFTQQKCLDRLINAFDDLTKEQADLRLVMLGAGPLEDALKNLARQKRSYDRMMFLGQVQDIDKYLKMSNIFVLSSDNEGLSLALMEAMATGLICISTKCTGSGEVIEDGITGFLVEKNTTGVLEGLRQALRLSDEDKKAMSSRARQCIVENFDIDKNIEKIFAAFGLPYHAVRMDKPV